MATGLEPLLPLIAATIGAAVVSAGGVVIGRKLGLTPAQAQYVTTLEGLNDALQKKATLMEDSARELGLKNAALEELNAELREENEGLKQEIFELREAKSATRRARRTSPGEESM